MIKSITCDKCLNRMPVYKTIRLIVTNRCNNACSFCYRTKFKFGKDMTEEIALKIMEYALSKMPLADDVQFFFSGGEPLINFKVIKRVIKEYPQFQYYIITNGAQMTQEIADFLYGVNGLSLLWSLGDSKEKYGSILNKVKSQTIMAELVRKKHLSLGFLVNGVKNLFNDYQYLYENVSTNIHIDLPMKGKTVEDDDIPTFIEQLCLIFKKYGEDVMIASKSLSWHLSNDDGWKSCNCGIDRMVFDSTGQAWQCDGSYRCQTNKIGDIENGLDYSTLKNMWILKDKPELLSIGCKDCEIYGRCPRVKCIGDNRELSSSIFIPDTAFCKSNKAIRYGIDKYIKEYKNA